MTDRYRSQPVWPWVLAAFSVLAAAGAVVFLVRSFDDAPTGGAALSSAASRAGELASSAEQINANWDAQRDVLDDPERSELFRQTAEALQSLIADTEAFVADLRAGQIGESVITEAEAMAAQAREMLDGLNAPGRTNVAQRTTALAAYVEAAAELQQLAGG